MMLKRSMCMAMVVLLLPASALAGTTCMQRSRALLTAMRGHHYTAARQHFDARVRKVVTADRLKQVWEQALPLRFGAYDPDAKGQSPRATSAARIVTPLHFSGGWLHMVVSCNAKGEIAGFNFRPGKTSAHDQATTKPKPASGSWGSSTLTQVKSPLGPLPALLTLPQGKGPFPAVVLVAGSGPHDLDESIGPNKPFRDIAQGLAAHGIASLRYDKRTFAYGAKMAGDKKMTIDQEVTDDALTAAHQLASTANIDPHRVFVLGHSLGAMLAPRIGKRDPELAGLVLMAAPTRSLLTVLTQQAREQGKRAGESAQKIAATEKSIASERRKLDAATPGHPPAGTFMHAPQSYWMSLHDYHQVAVAKSLSMPMLILQGGADFQVSPSRDFAQWKKDFAQDQRVTLHEYPGLSHLFMPAGKSQTVADYMKPRHVSAKVIADTARWIKAQPAR